MSPEENNANVGAPTPQVISPQNAPQPQAPAPVEPQLAQSPIPIATTEQQLIYPAQPVPAQQFAPAPTTEFTSNPFLTFGKGLGGGLYFNSGTILATGVLLLIASIGITFISAIVSGAVIGSQGSAAASLGTTLLFLLLIGLISAILLGRSAVALYKGNNEEKVSFKDTAQDVSFGVSLKILLMWVISSILITFGFLLLIIPGLIIWGRLSLAIYAITIEKLGPISAIKRSWVLTRRTNWEMLSANLVQNIGGGSSVLLVPAVFAASANRYKELVAIEQSGTIKANKVHWSNYAVPIVVALFIILYFAFIGYMFSSALGGLNTTTTGDNSSVEVNSSFPSGKYCYYDGEISDLNSEFKCTDSAVECTANSYCKESNSYQL